MEVCMQQYTADTFTREALQIYIFLLMGEGKRYPVILGTTVQIDRRRNT